MTKKYRGGLLRYLTVGLGLAACAQEATSPQSGAAVSRVVPVAVPDAWCPTSHGANDTIPANRRCQMNRFGQPVSGGDSTAPMVPGVWLVPDSARAATDSTLQR
jgi:hypothetical protein